MPAGDGKFSPYLLYRYWNQDHYGDNGQKQYIVNMFLVQTENDLRAMFIGHEKIGICVIYLLGIFLLLRNQS